MPTIIIIIFFPTQTQTRLHVYTYGWVLQQQYEEEKKKTRKCSHAIWTKQYYSNMKANWRKIIQKMPIRDCMGFELWRMNRGFLSAFFFLFVFFVIQFNIISLHFACILFLTKCIETSCFETDGLMVLTGYWVLIMYGFSFPFVNFRRSKINLRPFLYTYTISSWTMINLIFSHLFPL